MPCEGSERACLDCIGKPGENQIWKSERTSELVKMCSEQVRGDPYWAPAHQTTQNGTLTTSGLLKSGNLVKCRTQVRRDPYITSLSSMMVWTLTPPQNRTFLQKPRSFLNRVNDRFRKNFWPFFERCNARHRQFFYYLVNVYVFDVGSIRIHGKELVRQFTFHQKYRWKISQSNRCSTYLRNSYRNNQTRSMEWLQLTGKVLHGSI